MAALKKFFDYKTEDSVVNRIRKKRFDLLRGYFETLIEQKGSIRILDIGGDFAYWLNVGWTNTDSEIYLLNLSDSVIPPGYPNFHSVVGNALSLSYQYGEFDIIFSNSVIEHMGSLEGQQQFADKVRQISKCYIIQTPSLWFPLEPHCRIPFFQFIPHSLRAFLIMYFNINYFPRVRNYQKALAVSKTTIMFDKKRFQKLFPEAVIITETFWGLPKSYIAIKFIV